MLDKASSQIHPQVDSVLHFQSIDSTNSEARRIAKEFSDQNVLLVADEQTAGRGQYDRSWSSFKGKGLWMTLLLNRPGNLSDHPEMISLYTGYITAIAIEKATQVEPQLKWPNDIMLAGKKCGGILTEIIWQGATIRSVLIGIGLNLHHLVEDFPKELKEKSTSLALAGAVDISDEGLVKEILRAFWEQTQLLENAAQFIEKLNQRLYGIHHQVSWSNGSTTLEGVFSGINTEGAALVESAAGMEVVRSGSFRF